MTGTMRPWAALGVFATLAAAGWPAAFGQEGEIRPVKPDRFIPGVEVPGHGLLGVAGPFTHRNLTVFYLYEQKPRPDAEYITLEEGVRAGLVKVSESPEARVEQLLITNESQRPLFLISGELVRGGKQDRTVRMSMVVPPGTKNAPLPALCVERGRWTGEAKFAPQGDMVGNRAQSAMNSAAAESGASQQRVWDSVASYKGGLRAESSRAAGVPVEPSRTSSMTEELNDKGVQDLIDGYVKAVGEKHVPLRRPLGLAYAVDGKLTGLHVFHSSTLFRQMSLKIVRSAATDAGAAGFRAPVPAVTVKDLANFIAAAWDGAKSTETPGLGNEVIRYVSAETFTAQLFFKGTLVHSQVGRAETPAPPVPPPPPPPPPPPMPPRPGPPRPLPPEPR